MEIKRKKILITDDSRGAILYLSNVLNRLGFQVIPAVEGNEVEKLMRLMAPHLVILDAEIPGRNALDVLRDLKNKPEHAEIPVVMTFPEPDDEKTAEAVSSGAVEYIIKPIDLNLLHDIIQNYLFRTSPRRRKHLRCPFNGNVAIKHGEQMFELESLTLSEGGIFLKKSPPLSVGSNLSVSLAPEGQKLHFRGTIIYKNDGSVGGLDLPQGIAVEFLGGSHDDFQTLSDFIKRELEREE